MITSSWICGPRYLDDDESEDLRAVNKWLAQALATPDLDVLVRLLRESVIMLEKFQCNVDASCRLIQRIKEVSHLLSSIIKSKHVIKKEDVRELENHIADHILYFKKFTSKRDYIACILYGKQPETVLRDFDKKLLELAQSLRESLLGKSSSTLTAYSNFPVSCDIQEMVNKACVSKDFIRGQAKKYSMARESPEFQSFKEDMKVTIDYMNNIGEEANMLVKPSHQQFIKQVDAVKHSIKKLHRLACICTHPYTYMHTHICIHKYT